LPALRARLSAAQLAVGARTYDEVSVTAEAAPGGGTLELESEGLAGSASWPATVDDSHPALVHLSRLDAPQLGDGARSAGLAAAGFRPELAASRARLTGELEWPQAASPSLATLAGSLHMRLERGVTRTAAAAEGGVPLALLTVPALTAGMRAENRDGVLPAL